MQTDLAGLSQVRKERALEVLISKYNNLEAFRSKCFFHFGYRQLQGFIEGVCAFLNFSIPDFRTFWRRVNSMEKQRIRFSPIPKNRKINIAIDLTDLKLVNDGVEYVFSRKSGNVEKEIIAKTNLLNFYITSQT